MSTTYPIRRKAVKKLGAVNFTLIAPEHENKPLKRGDMVKIVVEQAGKGEPFVEVSSEGAIDKVIASNNLMTIAGTLANLNMQRAMLVTAALGHKDGEKYLKQRRLVTPYDFQEQTANVQADNDDGSDKDDGDTLDVGDHDTTESSGVISTEFDELNEEELEALTDPNGEGGDNGGDVV